MPYYHVKIAVRDPETKLKYYFEELDFSEEDVKLFAEQYQEGQVLFKGKWIDSSNIEEVEIRQTPKNSKEYYPTLDSATIFYGKRTDIKIVTRQFIKSPPKKEKTLKKYKKAEKRLSKNIFIVHGRDDKPKLELARMLEKLGFNIIILSEQPDKGRTIIEKLEQETIDIGFAFVILTPDDVGCSADYIIRGPLVQKPRARQNVILELGYFAGKIGRDRVCCLHKGDIELPSDIHGIVYIPFKETVNEVAYKIVKELKAAGYEIKI